LAVEVHSFHIGHVVVCRNLALACNDGRIVAYKAWYMGVVVDFISRFPDSVMVVVGSLSRFNQRMLAPKRNITVADSNASVSSMRFSLQSGVLRHS